LVSKRVIYKVLSIVYYGGDCLAKNVTDVGSIGSKVVRFCVLQEEKVSCHGVCRGAFVSESGSGKTEVVMCPIYVDAFDLAVNCSEKSMLRRVRVGVKSSRC
jgi:hypothetical protein